MKQINYLTDLNQPISNIFQATGSILPDRFNSTSQPVGFSIVGDELSSTSEPHYNIKTNDSERDSKLAE
jgi:hypothetical protein